MPRGMHRRPKRAHRAVSSRAFGKAVRGLINREIETKQRRFSFNNLTPFAGVGNGLVLDVAQIDLGSDKFSRVGNRIRIVGIHIAFRAFSTDRARWIQVRSAVFVRKGRYSTDQPLPPAPNVGIPVDPGDITQKRNSFRVLQPSPNANSQMSWDYIMSTRPGGSLVTYDGATFTSIIQGHWIVCVTTDAAGTGDLVVNVIMDVFYKNA